jgi:hypothetical protein
MHKLKSCWPGGNLPYSRGAYLRLEASPIDDETLLHLKQSFALSPDEGQIGFVGNLELLFVWLGFLAVGLNLCPSVFIRGKKTLLPGAGVAIILRAWLGAFRTV